MSQTEQPRIDELVDNLERELRKAGLGGSGTSEDVLKALESLRRHTRSNSSSSSDKQVRPTMAHIHWTLM
jgi:hypothetical protein